MEKQLFRERQCECRIVIKYSKVLSEGGEFIPPSGLGEHVLTSRLNRRVWVLQIGSVTLEAYCPQPG